jgi:hypothetical protein
MDRGGRMGVRTEQSFAAPADGGSWPKIKDNGVMIERNNDNQGPGKTVWESPGASITVNNTGYPSYLATAWGVNDKAFNYKAPGFTGSVTACKLPACKCTFAIYVVFDIDPYPHLNPADIPSQKKGGKYYREWHDGGPKWDASGDSPPLEIKELGSFYGSSEYHATIEGKVGCSETKQVSVTATSRVHTTGTVATLRFTCGRNADCDPSPKGAKNPSTPGGAGPATPGPNGPRGTGSPRGAGTEGQPGKTSVPNRGPAGGTTGASPETPGPGGEKSGAGPATPKPRGSSGEEPKKEHSVSVGLGSSVDTGREQE